MSMRRGEGSEDEELTARDDWLQINDGGSEAGTVESLAGDIEGRKEEGGHDDDGGREAGGAQEPSLVPLGQ